MAYRNITVEGTAYKYVIGRTHTKIRGLGVFKNEDIGHWEDIQCGCCGEPLRNLGEWNQERLDKEPTLGMSIRVTPKDIVKVIRNG